jgi:hypothetical protein
MRCRANAVRFDREEFRTRLLRVIDEQLRIARSIPPSRDFIEPAGLKETA